MEVLCKPNELKHADLTDAIIDSFYDVYNELRHGFLEGCRFLRRSFEDVVGTLKFSHPKKATCFSRGRSAQFQLLAQNEILVLFTI